MIKKIQVKNKNYINILSKRSSTGLAQNTSKQTNNFFCREYF